MVTQALLTEVQACERLQLSRTTLRRLWREQILVPVRVGRAVRYAECEIDSYIEKLLGEREDLQR